MILRDKGPLWINLGMNHSTHTLPLPFPLGLTHPIDLQRTPFSGSIPQGSYPFSLKTRDWDRVESQSYLSTTESGFSLARHLTGCTPLRYSSWMGCLMVLPRNCQGVSSGPRQAQTLPAKSAFSSTSAPRPAL